MMIYLFIHQKIIKLKNNIIQTDFDHRIAMAFCVMATKIGPFKIK